tara:strand:+ start:435 stop:1031 length:597 start_codon:yes stop_codon:yes gene_type:complete
MKYLSIFLLVLVFSCSSEEKNTNKISFEVSKAIHVKMTFERLAEFENDLEKKKELQSLYTSLNIDSNPRFIGWKINESKQQLLKDFIENNKKDLLLDKNDSFVWKKQQKEVFLFQKNNKETLNLSRAIKSYTINGNSLEITLIPEGVKALRTYTLQSINKTLLLQINNQLVSVVIALGDFKDGSLIINNLDPKFLKSI